MEMETYFTTKSSVRSLSIVIFKGVNRRFEEDILLDLREGNNFTFAAFCTEPFYFGTGSILC
jgi:hypothetical protein